MTFGQFIKKRRKELGLRQDEVSDYGQSYIAKLEAGNKRITKRETIINLAAGLRLPTDERSIDRLLTYSILDKDPCIYFSAFLDERENSPVADSPNDEISISLQATEKEVLATLGPPDKKIRVPAKSKWIYQAEGIHIIFAEGKVVDVMFK